MLSELIHAKIQLYNFFFNNKFRSRSTHTSQSLLLITLKFAIKTQHGAKKFAVTFAGVKINVS